MKDETPPETSRMLDRLHQPSARPEFEQALKQQFLQGAFETPAAAAAPRQALRRPSWGPIVAGMLATAAAITLVWVRLTAETIHFEVIDGVAGAEIRIDGATYDLGDGARIARALARAREIRTLDQPLVLRVDDLLALELGPRSHIEILALSGDDGPMRLATEAGSLALATGPGFTGSELFVQTPDAGITVVGTAFAIHVLEQGGTCICCTEGQVTVASPGDAPCTAIPHNMSHVFRSGESLGSGPVMDGHVAGMKKLQSCW